MPRELSTCRKKKTASLGPLDGKTKRHSPLAYMMFSEKFESLQNFFEKSYKTIWPPAAEPDNSKRNRDE